MKKKIIWILTGVFLAADLLCILLYWKNILYFTSEQDVEAGAVFGAVVIFLLMLIGILGVLRSWEQIILKALLAVTFSFVVFTLGYAWYNTTVHKKINFSDVEKVAVQIDFSTEFSEEKIREIVDAFNDAQYIKRNPLMGMVGTPDRAIVIYLKDGSYIGIEAFGDQLAVQVSGREDADSCYWCVSREIQKYFQ